MPIAIIALVSPAPRIARQARAITISVNENRTSTPRISNRSVHPPAYPPTSPRNRPTVSEIPTAMTPILMVSCAPNTTRLNRSRPKSSVPNRCAPPGGDSRLPAPICKGSNGAIQGANNATITSAPTMQSPTTPLGLRSSVRQNRRPWPAVSSWPLSARLWAALSISYIGFEGRAMRRECRSPRRRAPRRWRIPG